jgi:hypothetical protein
MEPGEFSEYHRFTEVAERMRTESQVRHRSGLMRVRTDRVRTDKARTDVVRTGTVRTDPSRVDNTEYMARAEVYTWPCPRFTFGGGRREQENRREILTDWVAACEEEPSLAGRAPAHFRAAVETGRTPAGMPASGISRIILFDQLWVGTGRDVLLNALRTVAQCLYVAGATDRAALIIAPDRADSNRADPDGGPDHELIEDVYRRLYIPPFAGTLRVVSGEMFEFSQVVERFGFDR